MEPSLSNLSLEDLTGKSKCVAIWRGLATEFPDGRSRLEQLVLRIYAGECSLLPTVLARDWKSPRSLEHPNWKISKYVTLSEVFGTRVSPELCEWMMGFPVGWSDVTA